MNSMGQDCCLEVVDLFHNDIKKSLIRKFISIYLPDILLFSKF